MAPQSHDMPQDGGGEGITGKRRRRPSHPAETARRRAQVKPWNEDRLAFWKRQHELEA